MCLKCMYYSKSFFSLKITLKYTSKFAPMIFKQLKQKYTFMLFFSIDIYNTSEKR